MKTKTANGRPKAPDVRILVVDDHPIVRQGLRLTIQKEKDMAVCCEAEDAPAAFRCIRHHAPTFAIVDISLGGRNGLDLIKDIRALHKDMPILVLSVHDEAIYAERALKAGARGYVVKQDAPGLIIRAIRRILAGEFFVSESIVSRILSRLGSAGPDSSEDRSVHALSDRELDVLERIGQGKGTRDIARSLNLSINTVETHRSHIKRKLQLRNSAQLAKFAVERFMSRRGLSQKP